MNLICPICGHNHGWAWYRTRPTDTYTAIPDCPSIVDVDTRCSCEVTLADALAAEQARATWALAGATALPLAYNDDVPRTVRLNAEHILAHWEEGVKQLAPPEVQGA